MAILLLSFLTQCHLLNPKHIVHWYILWNNCGVEGEYPLQGISISPGLRVTGRKSLVAATSGRLSRSPCCGRQSRLPSSSDDSYASRDGSREIRCSSNRGGSGEWTECVAPSRRSKPSTRDATVSVALFSSAIACKIWPVAKLEAWGGVGVRS